MTTHALLSPSAAHRWIHCPGSVALTKDLPNPSSAAAEYGTLAHAVSEAILTEASLDEFKNHPLFDEYLSLYAAAYVDTARQYMAEGDQILVEERLSITSITGEDEAYGTADLVILGDHLTVIDAKFGIGRVEVEDNPQLKIYALAVARKYGYQGKILTVIVQPRAHYVGECWYDTDELEEFAVQVGQSAEAALLMAEDGLAPVYQPDPNTCKWCTGKAYCPSLAEEMFDHIQHDYPLHQLASWTDLARKWADAVDERVLDTLQAGLEVPGWELGTSRPGNRKWIDELQAAEALGDQAYVQVLISPAKAEKILGKGALEPLTYREPGKPVAKKV